MNRLPSRFASFRALDPRERRVVAAGAAIALLSLLTVFGVLPYMRRWSEREAAVAAARDQRDRLRALVASESAIRHARDLGHESRGSWRRHLVSGSTPALAASELQALIRRYAEQSQLQVDRINVLGDPAPIDSALTAIPLQIAGEGDIRGLVDLLALLQHGERLLVVDGLTVTANPPRPDGTQPLGWSIRLRAPYLAEGSS